MEQRRVNRYRRLLADAYLERVLLDFGECDSGVRIASWVPSKVEVRPRIPWPGAVERQDVARDAARAQIRGRGSRVVGASAVGVRNPYAETPRRHFRRAAGERGVALQHLRGIATGDQEYVERFVVDDEAVGALRPVGITDAVQHARRRVDVDAPGAAAGARAPAERHARARCGRRGIGLLDLRLHQLAALAERSGLCAQAVYRLARSQRVRSDPRLSLTRAADRRQSRLPVASTVGDRREHRLSGMQKPKRQRGSGELERSIARRERPRAARRLRDIAALCAGREQPIVGACVGTDAQAEDPRTEAADLEHVTGRGGERGARRRCVEAAGCIDPKVVARVESHGAPARICNVRVDSFPLRRTGDQPANFGSGNPGTSTCIAKMPPDCGSRASSAASRI